MNKIFSCRNNLPVYVGNYPSKELSGPGLKPRKLDYFYEVTQEPAVPNFDKISGSESSNRIVDSNKGPEVPSDQKANSDPEPALDLDQPKHSGKTKLDQMFKVHFFTL